MVEKGRSKCGIVNENTIFETFIFHDTIPQIQHQNVTNLYVKWGEEENGGQKSRDESNIIQKVENWWMDEQREVRLDGQKWEHKDMKESHMQKHVTILLTLQRGGHLNSVHSRMWEQYWRFLNFTDKRWKFPAILPQITSVFFCCMWMKLETVIFYAP
jgi:hypothetical protein